MRVIDRCAMAALLFAGTLSFCALLLFIVAFQMGLPPP